MSVYLSQNLQRRLAQADNRHCAYCHTKEANTSQPTTIDHILPRAQGGLTVFENLCFACRLCNEFKGSQISAVDPLSGVVTTLFHPRREVWAEHFVWDETSVTLLGLTATGRATIIALQINHPIMVAARRRWVSVGWHP